MSARFKAEGRHLEYAIVRKEEAQIKKRKIQNFLFATFICGGEVLQTRENGATFEMSFFPCFN